MLYVIIGTDASDSGAARGEAREAHVGRIRSLCDDGRLVLAGPQPAIDAEDPGPAGFDGSLIVAEFASLADARAWAEGDPYLESGAWVRVEARPFVQVLP
ncbi:MAG: YciI family protein [Wenzhouxiangellaceae bacterium]|nr:YciI family protein [Wenzhouxiangellaceae bacterium]